MLQNRNGMMAALIIADVTCWSALIFLAFKWATCQEIIMNDELLNILLTESDVNMIMDILLDSNNLSPETQDLAHDLMEQVARQDDGWDLNPTDLNGRTFTIAEDDFIDAGIQAREQAKATSMAADRRTMRFTRSDTDEREPSEQQRVDIWDRPNDPLKW